MHDVLLALVALGSASQLPWLAPSRCFVPADQSPGWKKVAVPSEAPALAAPDDIDQFRGGESALVVEDGIDTLALETPSHWGQTSFSFRVEPLTARWLSVTFADAIDGAKVDVVGFQQGRSRSLRRGRRERSTSVSIAWDEPFDLIVVTVAHHLRPSPVVRSVEIGQRPSEATITATGHPDRPLAYQAPGFLYFRHPGDRELRLCNRTAALLRYHRGYWDDAPKLIDLRR